jgi:hypothetical protein
MGTKCMGAYWKYMFFLELHLEILKIGPTKKFLFIFKSENSSKNNKATYRSIGLG